jgi:3-oxoadipate enol-lactonase
VRSIRVNGVRIAYEDSAGDGVPVVFIHAFPLNSRMWLSQVRALAPRRTVVLDLMGFGESDAPDDPSAYSVDGFASQVVAVIEAVVTGPVALCGLSLGGYVSFALLRSAPQLVAALVLADTRAEPDTVETRAKRARQQVEVRARGPEPLMDELTSTLPSQTTIRDKPGVIRHIRELMDNPPAGIVGALEALKTRPDSTPILRKITVPTLVIAGEDDAITPVDSARGMSESIPTSELAVIPGAGHLSNLEAPEAFNRALEEFLSRH